MPARYAPIVFEDGAWIASKSTILQGVTVGKGAVVCCGAVVTSDLLPYTIYGGIPAKPIRPRNLPIKGVSVMD